MAHWRQLMDSDKLKAHHLCDKDGNDCDIAATIVSVNEGEVHSEDNKKKAMPKIMFKGQPLPFYANVTNATSIERIAGTGDYRKWGGVRVQLYPTTTTRGRETVPCIRIRPQAPTQKNDGPVMSKAREPGVEG